MRRNFYKHMLESKFRMFWKADDMIYRKINLFEFKIIVFINHPVQLT